MARAGAPEAEMAHTFIPLPAPILALNSAPLPTLTSNLTSTRTPTPEADLFWRVSHGPHAHPSPAPNLPSASTHTRLHAHPHLLHTSPTHTQVRLLTRPSPGYPPRDLPAPCLTPLGAPPPTSRRPSTSSSRHSPLESTTSWGCTSSKADRHYRRTR